MDALIAAARDLNSPTSPTSAGLGPAPNSRREVARRCRSAVRSPQLLDVPPPSAHATAEGTATHLGRFTGTLTAEVNPDSNTSTGTFTLHCGEWRPAVWHICW